MTAPAPQPNRMGLDGIRRGVRPAPDRIFMHGTEGVGKSTFAANSPSPIFIAAEDGIRHLDVASFPEPKTFTEILQAVATLLAEEHPYQTIVIDTVDWVEPLLWAGLCLKYGWENIETPGYGKGFTIALEGWRRLLSGLDQLRAKKGMEVILLAHSQIRLFSNPAGEDYSRYEGKLNSKAYALLKEWADVVLFATHEEFTREGKGFSKAKGVSTGRRVVHTKRTAAWDAKERHGLPDELPLSYLDYAQARIEAKPEDPAKLMKEATALVAELKLDDETKKKTEAWLKAAERKGPLILAQAVDRLRTKVAAKGEA